MKITIRNFSVQLLCITGHDGQSGGLDGQPGGGLKCREIKTPKKQRN